jgi:DNA-directed RNA polymerase subunit RPC12/RpoP
MILVLTVFSVALLIAALILNGWDLWKTLNIPRQRSGVACPHCGQTYRDHKIVRCPDCGHTHRCPITG